MNAKKIVIIILVAILVVVLNYFGWRTVVGNRDILDFGNNRFSKAYIYLGGAWMPVSVKSWVDYEGDVVQIKTTEGRTYLTQYTNLVLVGGD